MAFLIANMPTARSALLEGPFLAGQRRARLQGAARGSLGQQDSGGRSSSTTCWPTPTSMKRATPGGRNSSTCACRWSRIARRPARRPQMLNRSVFPKLKVSYSTQRKKPHQSPSESIEQGKASCTGLSIILSDACRSVGIPARLVGTPLWTNNSGNHTWVEIWDDGWHFTGACEPTPRASTAAGSWATPPRPRRTRPITPSMPPASARRRSLFRWSGRREQGRLCRERHRSLHARTGGQANGGRRVECSATLGRRKGSAGVFLGTGRSTRQMALRHQVRPAFGRR